MKLSRLLTPFLCLVLGLAACKREHPEWTEPTVPYTIKAQESPRLTELVKEGKLPPLVERLPKNPVVAPTFGPHARYGGTLRIAVDGYWAYGGLDNVFSSRLFLHLPKTDEKGRMMTDEKGNILYHLTGNLAESWEYAPDGRSITVQLREGIRYSDGHPFTTEDIAYRWAIWNDSERYGAVSPFPIVRIGNDPVGLEVVDAKTFRFLLPEPDFQWLADSAAQLQFWETPKHWLAQYDPNLNPDIIGWDAFRRRLGSFTNLERPVLGPWKLVKWDEAADMVAERNPYFYMVDGEGRQLPYIDRVQGLMTRNPEVASMRVMAGQIDIYDGGQVQDLALLKSGERRGDYRLYFAGEGPGTYPGLIINFLTDRPHLAELFRKHEFRLALSTGIDRAEINDLVFGGFGTPTSVSFGPWFTDTNIQYEPERAAQILANLGLRDLDGDGILQYADGTDVTIVITAISGVYATVCELVASHWKQLGIDAVVQNVHPNQYSVQRRNRRFDLLAAHNGSFRVDRPMRATGWSPFSSPLDLERAPGRGLLEPFQRWQLSGGAQGFNPGTDLLSAFVRLQELEVERRLEPDPKKAEAYAHDISKIWAEEILMLGLVGRVPIPLVVSRRILNVPSVIDAPPEGAWLRAGLYPFQLVLHPDPVEEDQIETPE